VFPNELRPCQGQVHGHRVSVEWAASDRPHPRHMLLNTKIMPNSSTHCCTLLPSQNRSCLPSPKVFFWCLEQLPRKQCSRKGLKHVGTDVVDMAVELHNNSRDGVLCHAEGEEVKMLLVVAAALIDGRGRVLLAKRPEGKTLGGLWEFPGGKVGHT
jgi:hypothetical protein